MSRGIPKKSKTEHEMTIARPMVTRNYLMRWVPDRSDRLPQGRAHACGS